MPVCSPAMTMTSLSSCLSRSTILYSLNSCKPQGSVYTRLTHPNVHIHTHLYTFRGRDTHTHLQKQGHAHACVPTHVHSFAIDIFTKCSLCKPNKVGSSAIYFQPRRRFSVSLLPLSSSQSFLKVHICQWFVNQPAKFTTLRSNVFYSWLCCM